MLPRSVKLVPLIWRRLSGVVIVIAVHGLENDGPARRKDGLMDIQFIGFEGEASKDRGDSDGLAIGQVD